MEQIPMKDERESASCVGTKHDLNDSEDSTVKDIAGRVISKQRFLAGDQWSQEENCGHESYSSDRPSPLAVNGLTSVYTEVNCCNHSGSVPNVSKQCFNQNNNLVVDKSNLRCTDEKYCCYFLKFPVKVNNNIFPEKSTSTKNDGMNEYFQQNSSVSHSSNYATLNSLKLSSNSDTKSISKLVSDQYFIPNNDSRSPDQINALNGEEEDEDNGCIYTYKGDNYEANLSHLLETCFSCGLPTSERSVPQHGAVSIQRILNGSSPNPNPNPQSNLYSPDMDFLEMDFDPGSTGDGGDSDCEDNSVLNVDLKLDEDNSLESFAKLDKQIDKKSNNIPNEMKSLMCRRCEMCIYNDQKVNNTSSSFTQKLNLGTNNHPNSFSQKLNSEINNASNSFSQQRNSNIDNSTSHFTQYLNSDDNPANSFDEKLSTDVDATNSFIQKLNSVISSTSSSNFTEKHQSDSSSVSNMVTHNPIPDFSMQKNITSLIEEEFDLSDTPSNKKLILNSYSNLYPESNNLYGNEKTGTALNHVENNLDSDDRAFNEDFSDGDEADDEGGDDSTSELPPSDGSSEVQRVNSSSLFLPSSASLASSTMNGNSTNDFKENSLISTHKINKQLRFSSETNYFKLPNGIRSDYKLGSEVRKDFIKGQINGDWKGLQRETVNSDKVNTKNNNLGSISAPEVSPSTEFSPLEKFSRSISFHNQLSSPKYENSCFSHPYKDNFLSNMNKYSVAGNSNDCCNCKHGNLYCKTFQNSESSNMEACVDRLNQREKSVFNITSSSSSSPQHSKSPSRCAINSVSASITNGNSSLYQFQEAQNISNTSNSVMSDDVNGMRRMHNTKLPFLPNKMVSHKNNDPSVDPNTACERDLEADENDGNSKSSVVEKVMIWTERQATFRQVSQVGTSACGPTAVINVLLALDHSRPVKTVTSAIKTRLRAENGSLVEYLLSRSNAGTTHEDLLSGVETVSEGSITGRFFHLFPKRAFQLSRWLSYWIKKGGVPVATLNLQVGVSPNQTIPDAWHHQMVFGVGENGIYLTNPLECVSDSLLSDQLCSDSILLVRRADIESRWDQNDKLINLSLQSDPRWNDMNVLGQVVCVLKEQAAPEMLQGRRHLTYHVAIPASYQSGVTIFIRADNPCKKDLLEAPELPLLDE